MIPKSRWFSLFGLGIGLLLSVACRGSSREVPASSETSSAEPDYPGITFAADLPPVTLDQSEGIRTFTIVPAESQASYVAREELFQGALDKYNLPIGDNTVTGVTDQIDGMLQLNLGASEPLGPNQFVVHLPSLTTGQDDRDGWIRENALESAKHPLAVFRGSGIRNAPADFLEGGEAVFDLVGEMTIREITHPMVFTVTVTLDGDTIRGMAEAHTSMTDWGFDPPIFARTLTVEDDFTLRISFTAREQQ